MAIKDKQECRGNLNVVSGDMGILGVQNPRSHAKLTQGVQNPPKNEIAGKQAKNKF
jgi:hypothetical protein